MSDGIGANRSRERCVRGLRLIGWKQLIVPVRPHAHLQLKTPRRGRDHKQRSIHTESLAAQFIFQGFTEDRIEERTDQGSVAN